MLAMLVRFATRRTSIAALTVAGRDGWRDRHVAGAQQRSNDRDFSWDGRIHERASGCTSATSTASIRVETSTGDRAEVTAVKRSRRGNPEDVRIETRRLGGDDGDVIICAFWTENASCDEDGYRSHGDNNGWRGRDNDTSVEFTVKLPAGVRLGVSTVNGGVNVSGATSEVRASTVNGRVSATSSGGPVNASTVNGDIDVRMRELGTGDLEYSTVNGSIEIEVPGEPRRRPRHADGERKSVGRLPDHAAGSRESPPHARNDRQGRPPPPARDGERKRGAEEGLLSRRGV